MELRIDLRKADGEHITWVYKTFRVNGSDDNYRLLIGEGEGPGVNAMAYIITNSSVHLMRTMMQFRRNCASAYLAGWWYNACSNAIFTGPHVNPAREWAKLHWYGTYYPNVEMKVRPKLCLTG